MFDYVGSPYAIPPKIVTAHRRAWSRLAAAGSWWTGAERVAMAAECRQSGECRLCQRRRQALSPYAEGGEHDRVREVSSSSPPVGREERAPSAGTEPSRDLLPDVAIEMIHRVTTDASRIKADWVRELESDGLAAGPYVEMLGVIVAVLSIDEFHRALGLPLEPLPTPQPGEPDGYRPPVLESETGWVPMIPADGLDARDADLWDDAIGNVVRAMSLVPDAVRQLLDLSAAHYLSVEEMRDLERGRTLDRRQIELVAGRVSALNECFY